jgi:hypothetical protein
MEDSVETELLPLTEMVSRMFTPEFVVFIKEKYGSVRKFYETSSAITQCNNTVGPLNLDPTNCWICGYGIHQTRAMEEDTEDEDDAKDGFSPECEHVFPIAQAIFFIGLYTNDAKDNAAYKQKLELEYAWAHRVCNQIKSDAHFIVHNIQNPDGRWGIDDNKIRVFLRDILGRGWKYGRGDELLREQIRMDRPRITVEDWIEKRTKVINKKCSDILRTIRPGSESFWTLATMSDLALAYQKSGFVPEVIVPYDIIARPAEAAPPTEVELTSFYVNWAQFNLKDVRVLMASYLTERPPYHPRLTPEEKAKRALKVLKLLDAESLIGAVYREAVWPVYNKLRESRSNPARFVEAIRYLIVSVIFGRINTIFIDREDSSSPSLGYLKSEIARIIEVITDVWNYHGLQDGIRFLNSILETRLKGASRRRY